MAAIKYSKRGTDKRTPEQHAWKNMVQRCTNPSHASWKYYGGRGILVCDEWLRSFETFLQDMGPRPSPLHSIDRIENNLGYSKDNCRWATKKQQNRNRRDTINITIDGKTQCLQDWCIQFSICRKTVEKRLKNGWSERDAIFTTPGTTKRKNTERHVYNGQLLSISELAEISSVHKTTLRNRIKDGWDIVAAVETPPTPLDKRSPVTCKRR